MIGKKLIDGGMPSASDRFTKAFNQVLLKLDGEEKREHASVAQDAFGISFAPLEESMPTVKLAGGFEVTLRTMFGANRCQTRYGRTDNASYPISPQMRLKLQAALNWLGDAERKNTTWMNIDKDEILFAYPHTLPKTNAQFVRAFKRTPNSETVFEKEAGKLISDLRGLHTEGLKAHADRLQVFILRKIDKARTKVLYTRVTDPVELEQRAAAWSRGCQNLPQFSFGQPQTPFPIDVADILNRAWKQDGTLATDKFKPMPHYRGMELLMDADEPAIQDLAMLAKNCISLASYLGVLEIGDRSHTQQVWWKLKDMLALCGLLLDRLDVRRESYMDDFPFQYGQLLKMECYHKSRVSNRKGKIYNSNKEERLEWEKSILRKNLNWLQR